MSSEAENMHTDTHTPTNTVNHNHTLIQTNSTHMRRLEMLIVEYVQSTDVRL